MRPDYLESRSADDWDLRGSDSPPRHLDWADRRSADLGSADWHLTDGSGWHWLDDLDSQCSQRWNSADWHSVGSGLPDSDLAGSHWYWAAQRPVDSADLVAQGVDCFEFALAGPAGPDDLQNSPLEEAPPS